MLREQTPIEVAISEANASMTSAKKSSRLAHISFLCRDAMTEIRNESFDPTSSYNIFERQLKVGGSNSTVTEHGVRKYAELKFKESAAAQLASAAEKVTYDEEIINLSKMVLIDPNVFRQDLADTVKAGEVVGRKGGMVGFLGLITSDFPGFREEEWAMDHEGEFSEQGWTYRVPSLIAGVDILGIFPQDRDEGSFSLIVSPLE